MNAATETSESFAAPATAPRPVRPFYWSVMRELWENRSLIIAPLVVGGFVLFVLIASAINTSHEVQEFAAVPPELQGRVATWAYAIVAWVISVVMHITVFFYLLDALQGERKDRSVLFWKSMPVSDTTTVLAKIFTALVISGAIVIVVAVATQLALMLLASVIFVFGGASPAAIWAQAELGQMTVVIIYWQIAIALWYAPVAAWLLFVSAWAKRVAILWALLPPIALIVFERVVFRTRHIQDMINARMDDPVLATFVKSARGVHLTIGDETIGTPMAGRVLDGIDPVAFIANPWLWGGLVVAAGLVAAAIWMRRYREPI